MKSVLVIGGLDTSREERAGLLDHQGIYEFGICCGAITKAYS